MSPPNTGPVEINMELVEESRVTLVVTDTKEDGKVSSDENGKGEVIPPPEKKVKLEGIEPSEEKSSDVTTASLKEEAGEDFKKPEDVDKEKVSSEKTANKLSQTDYRTDILRIGSVSLKLIILASYWNNLKSLKSMLLLS